MFLPEKKHLRSGSKAVTQQKDRDRFEMLREASTFQLTVKNK